MAKNKYYYAIVNKENGNLLLMDGRLPIYWNKQLAKEVAADFENYIVHPLSIEAVEKLILNSKLKSK